jgi:hypothetical protein
MPPSPMSPDELRDAMHTLGWTTAREAGLTLGVSRSTVSLWLQGKIRIPLPVGMLIRILVEEKRFT